MFPVTEPQAPPKLAAELLGRLRTQANPGNVSGMARYGINPDGTLGVPMPVLRGIGRELRPLRRTDPGLAHEVAGELWASGVHEARILAALVDVPALVTPEQADAWVADLDSWDVCDQLQGLFVPTPFAYTKAEEWSAAEPTFVKRAGLVLICALAVHDKRADDRRIIGLLPLVEREATDDRNYVKKAANWALRQVGKRSGACHAAAVTTAERILADHPGSATARWVARDALRELRSAPVLARVGASGPATQQRTS